MKRFFVLMLSAVMILSMTSCAKIKSRGSIWRSENTEAPKPAATEQIKVDIDNIPASLEPISGYYPYVMKFYYEQYNESSLVNDIVPLLYVRSGWNNTGYYTVQEAERAGIIKGLAAYTKAGAKVNTSMLAAWADMDHIHIYGPTYAVVYVFYLKEGVSAQISTITGSDLLMAGGVNSYAMLWSSAAVDRYGLGGSYLTYYVEPQIGDSSLNTAKCVDFIYDSYEGRTSELHVVHYYYFFKNINTDTRPIGR